MTLGDLVPWGRRDRNLAPSNRATPDAWRGDMSPFFSLHAEMNRLFDEAFRDFGLTTGRRSMATWPQIEVHETDEGYRLTAELPGMDEKDIELSLDNGVLTLRGEKKSEAGNDTRGYSEGRYGMFERRLQIGDVDEEKVNATFNKGVLTIELPRPADAKAQPKRIEISAQTHH